MSIQARIQKDLGAFRLDVALEAGDETLALLGASGSGKSMTLGCIAGTVRPDRGRIVVNGETLFDSDKRINRSPQQRRTGLLFQNYALFPNMTVEANLRAGLRRERSRKDAEARIRHTVAAFGLAPLLDRKPHQLSGGQQQRAALARILIGQPEILMLDEPFSALDTHLRASLEAEVRQVVSSFGGTVLLVSHERDEAYRLCERIAVMEDGRITRMDEKRRLFDEPGTIGCAKLTGCRNIVAVSPMGEARVHVPEWGIALSVRPEVADRPFAGIRAHAIRAGDGENAVCCTVLAEVENPFSVQLLLRPRSAAPDAAPIEWQTDKALWARIRAAEVTVTLPKDAIFGLTEGRI